MRLRYALLLLTAILLIEGCARQPQNNKVVIRLANWGGAGSDSAFDKLVAQMYKQFEADNPDIEIRVENNPTDYPAKMVLSYIAKAEPDVMMLDASSSALFIDNGVIKDLTPFIQSDKDFKLDAFFPNVVDIDRRGSALYAIPQDFTPVVLYYNKKLFDKAGVPYPKPGWNFNNFLATAKALTIPGEKPGDPPKQYGFGFKNWMAGWVMWLWNNDADVVSPDKSRAEGYFDGPKSVETIQFLSDLVTKYKLAPSISQMAAQGVDPFQNGEAAMTITGHWSMIDFANAPKDEHGKPRLTWDDLGVVELPHNTPQPQTVMYEAGYSIGAHCKHPEAAWKLIKYMTSYAFQVKYQSSGIAVCGRKDVAEERGKMPLEAQFLPIIPSARAPYGTRILGYDFVEKMGEGALDNILQGHMDVRQALHQAARKIDLEFAKNRVAVNQTVNRRSG